MGNDIAVAVAAGERYPVNAVADTLEVSRSNLVERLTDDRRKRGRYAKAADAGLIPLIHEIVDGDRRTAIGASTAAESPFARGRPKARCPQAHLPHHEVTRKRARVPSVAMTIASITRPTSSDSRLSYDFACQSRANAPTRQRRERFQVSKRRV
jgi:hypothetical protein